MSIWISMHCSMSSWLVLYYNIEMELYAVWCGLHFTLWLPFFHLNKRCRRRWTPKKHETKIEIWKREMLFNLHFNKTFTLSHPFGCLRFHDAAAQKLCINFILKIQNATIDNLHKMSNRRNISSDEKKKNEQKMWMKRKRDC